MTKEEILKVTFLVNTESNISINRDNENETWEVIWMNTKKHGEMDMTLTQLQYLNLNGLVYVGEQTGIDYEGSETQTDMMYMDIAYFKEINK